jgi:hypothetical protein
MPDIDDDLYEKIHTQGLAGKFDPALVGEWRSGNMRYLYDDEGYAFVGTVAASCTLEDGGSTLNYSGTRYDRISGDASSVAGHWRSDADGEDWILFDDGRYVSFSDDFWIAVFGSFGFANDVLTNLECRARIETSDDQMIAYVIWGYVSRAQYQIQDNTLTITDESGGVTMLTRYEKSE